MAERVEEASPNDVKNLRAFEMRKDCALEATETNGWCPSVGEGRGGSGRAHTDPAYADLRKRLKIDD